MKRAAFCAAVLALSSFAAADSPARTLATAAVAEAGWTASRDHAAMWHVFARRSARSGSPIDVTARAYCAAWRAYTPRTIWVRGLEKGGSAAPGGWPEAVRWEPHRKAFAAVEDAAEAFLRGELADPCGSCAPDHFGGPMDHARAKRAGWSRCDCGDTVQQYWRSKTSASSPQALAASQPVPYPLSGDGRLGSYGGAQ